MIEQSGAFPSSLSQKVCGKLNAVLHKSFSLGGMKRLMNALDRRGLERCLHKWRQFSSPVTSVDVERSFSAFTLIISDKRQVCSRNSGKLYYCLYSQEL